MAKKRKPSAEWNPANYGAAGFTFRCYGCGKTIEIPYNADRSEYGWFFGTKRHCTYSCMRKTQKKEEQRMRYEGVSIRALHKTNAEKRQNSFVRLCKYIDLLESGMPREEAYIAAGYPTLNTAKCARTKWGKHPDFIKYREERE